MLGLLQVDHQRPGRAYSQRKAFNRESLEGLHAELLPEPFDGGIVDESPLLDCGDEESIPVPFLDPFLETPLNHNLFRVQGGDKRAYVVQRSLSHLERACGDIQESRSAPVPVECEAGQEIILLLVQKLVIEGYSWRDKFGDTSFDKFLGEFRVFQLIADGHLVAGADKFREVGINGVVRESGHLDVALVPVGFLGLDDAQNLADQHRVIGIRLVEVSDPVKQHRLRMLSLHREKLFDERSVLQHLSFCHVNVCPK